MRRVHIVLLLLILAVMLVGALERVPRLAGEDADDGRVHIAYWEKWASFEGEAAQAMVDAFNASQDEIFVHRIRTSDIDRKAMLAIIGGDPPDVVGLWDRNVPPFAEGKALMPLDELMAEAGLTEGHYIDHYLNHCRHEGSIYALPTTPASVALFYNLDHYQAKAAELRAAGLDPDRPPRTIEELDRYAAVLTEFNDDDLKTPKVMGFLPTEPGWFNSVWGYYFGGTLYDESTGRIMADSPQNVRAYMWAKQFAEAYGREKLLNFRAGFGGFDSPQNGFIDGKISMVMQGVWFPNFIRRHRPHLRYAVAPFPTAEGVPGPMSQQECDVIAIPRGSKHPAEAWKFIEWMQKGEGLAILNRMQGKHLPIREYDQIDKFRASHPNPFLKVFEELAASPHAFLTPQVVIWNEYRTEMEQAFDHIFAWAVPAEPLKGLTGQARQDKMDELIRAEVQRALAEVAQRMQNRLDTIRQRELLRREAGQ